MKYRVNIKTDKGAWLYAWDEPVFVMGRGYIQAFNLRVEDDLGYAFGHIVYLENVMETGTETENVSVNVSLSAEPSNDYVCPTCQNDKCSKSEKICWRCGNKL
jgi:hypothetical protein